MAGRHRGSNIRSHRVGPHLYELAALWGLFLLSCPMTARDPSSRGTPSSPLQVRRVAWCGPGDLAVDETPPSTSRASAPARRRSASRERAAAERTCATPSLLNSIGSRMPRWACTRIRRASRSRAASASGPRAALHPAVYRSFQAASKASTSICVVSGSREVGVVGGPTRFMPNTLRSLPVSTTRNGEKSFVAYPTPETACRPSLSLCAHQVAGAWSPLASAVTRRSRSRQPPARYARAPSSAHASAGLPGGRNSTRSGQPSLTG